MMTRIIGIGVALLVAVGAGWVWGAAGRSDLNGALRIAELRAGLLEGRAAVLDARLDIYSFNFGEASRHLEAARSALRAAGPRLTSLGRQADTKSLELALRRSTRRSAWPVSSIRMRMRWRRTRRPRSTTCSTLP